MPIPHAEYVLGSFGTGFLEPWSLPSFPWPPRLPSAPGARVLPALPPPSSPSASVPHRSYQAPSPPPRPSAARPRLPRRATARPPPPSTTNSVTISRPRILCSSLLQQQLTAQDLWIPSVRFSFSCQTDLILSTLIESNWIIGPPPRLLGTRGNDFQFTPFPTGYCRLLCLVYHQSLWGTNTYYYW
jgi:hypothetical protein